MQLYSVFGGVLRSELELPELNGSANGSVDWELRVSTVPAAADAGLELVGSEPVTRDIEARLFRHAQRLRLVFDDTGTFELDPTGRHIVWYAVDGVRIEAVRMDVLGRVLPLALHLRDTFTLHGSAVAIGAGATAFIAPKYHGKSTLARALIVVGGRLLTDDAVAVRVEDRALVLPGVHSMRLRADSADRLGAQVAASSAAAVQSGMAGPGSPLPATKYRLRDLRAAQLATEPVPLTAVYLVTPIDAETADAATRRIRLPEMEATITLLTQMKLGGLLGASGHERVLRFCAELARLVPVYRLEVARDFDLLPAVAARIAEWQDDGSPRRRAVAR